jgi:hypothetical protein
MPDTPAPPTQPAGSPRVLATYTSGSQLAYKPQNYIAANHYSVRGARWQSWSTARAVAKATLIMQFPTGPTRRERVTLTYSTPQLACGGWVYTVLRSNGHSIARLNTDPAICFFQIV